MLSLRQGQTTTNSILTTLTTSAKTWTNNLNQISNLMYAGAVSYMFSVTHGFHPPFDMVKTAFIAAGRHYLVKTADGIAEFNDVIAALNNGTCGADTNTTVLSSSQYTKLEEWYDNDAEELADFYRSLADMPEQEVENCTKALLQAATDLYNGPQSSYDGFIDPEIFAYAMAGISVAVVAAMLGMAAYKVIKLYRTPAPGPVGGAPVVPVGDDLTLLLPTAAPVALITPIAPVPTDSGSDESSDNDSVGSESAPLNNNNNNHSRAPKWLNFALSQKFGGNNSDSDLGEDSDHEYESPSP